MGKTAFQIIDDFIYELNVDHSKCSKLTSELLDSLREEGYSIVDFNQTPAMIPIRLEEKET